MKSLSVVTPSPMEFPDPKSRSPSVSTCPSSTASVSSSSSSSSASSGTSSSARRATVDGNKIRSRLLTKLGIVQQPPPGSKAARPPAMRKVAPFSVPLKHDDDEDKKKDAEPCSNNAPSPKRSSRVAFDDQVSVVPIPKHQEYSQRIRSRLWCDKRELRTMAARNTLEYQAEGWHPSTVVEDEGFITTANGERIHPVHLHRLLSSSFLSMRPPMKILQLRPPVEVRQPL